MDIVTCSGCGYRMFGGNSTAYQRDTEVCSWCRRRGLSGKEAESKPEAKMGIGADLKAAAGPQFTWHRWRCSCCDLVKAASAMDARWRWTGSAYEHKCEGNDPQAGYFDCTDIDHQPVEDVTHLSAATPAGHPEFYKIVEDMKALHEKKAKDYGLGKDVLANCRGSEDFGIPGWIGVVMRMNDKMTRLKSFAQKGSLANESVEDSLIDLANYAVLSLILYRESSKK